ncbi:hypothetical protein AB9F39_37285, partial [Rhizobium leguminosarum]
SDALRLSIPALSLTLLLAAFFWLQPRAMSYVGLNLLFNLSVPIAQATKLTKAPIDKSRSFTAITIIWEIVASAIGTARLNSRL